MRTKRRTIAFTVLVLVVGAFAYAILTRDREPRYKDRSLSEWLEIYETRQRTIATRADAARAEAELAVRSIGTNALPFALEWMRYEPMPWRERLPKKLPQALQNWPDLKHLIRGKSARRAERARLVFEILKTNAVSATPELEKLLKDSQTPVVGLRAVLALGKIGGPAIPVLTNALADPNQANHYDIFLTLFHGSYGYDSTDRTACLPAMLRSLNDPNAEVRDRAKTLLEHFAPETLTNAPPK